MTTLFFILAHTLLLNGAALVWLTPTSHDFGAIPKNQSVKYIFEFKNMSKEPLVIENVRTDCGCTATDWDEEPVGVAQNGKITVLYDAVKTGIFYKKLTVWIKGQRKPEKLIIEGNVLE